MRNLIAALVALGLLALSSCGGTGSDSTRLSLSRSAPSVDPGPLVSAGLPALPNPGNFLPARMAATAEVTYPASANLDALSGAGLNGAELVFAPGPGELHWAVYKFNNAPGEDLNVLTYHLDPSSVTASTKVWIALSNFAQKSWYFLPPQTEQSKTIDLSAIDVPFTNGSGEMYIAFMAYDGGGYTLHDMRFEYPDRFSAFGTVVDTNGAGIPGVLVSTPAFGLQTVTDANGDFTLEGLPDGNWPIGFTKDEWTFYDNPAFALVDGTSSDVGQVIGNRNKSNFIPVPDHDGPGYEQPIDLNSWSIDNPIEGSLSVFDDPSDYYSLDFSGSGIDRLNVGFTLVNEDGGILFPTIYIYDSTGQLLGSSSGFVLSSGALANAVPDEDDTRFLVSVGCGAGGGRYKLYPMRKFVSTMSGTISEGANGLNRVIVNAKTDNDELFELNDFSLNYYTSGNVNAGQFIETAWPTSHTILTPSAPNYSFTPPVGGFNIYLDPISFQGAPVQTGDGYEPNDASDAAPLLVLPYDSTQDTPLSIGGVDENDWYRVSPGSAADTCLEVQLNWTDTGLGGGEAVLSIYDADAPGFPVATGVASGTGARARLMTNIDGGDYLIRVARFFNARRKVPYSLKTSAINAYPLQVEARLDNGGKLRNAVFDYQSAAFDDRQSLTTDEQGLTPARYYKPGEIVNVECRRYGYNINRNTRRLVMPAEATTLSFVADALAGPDSLEPNETTAAAAGELPLEIHASFAETGDFSDFYSFEMPAGEKLHLHFFPSDQGSSSYSVNLYDSTEAYTDGQVIHGITDTWLETGAGGLMRLELYGNGRDSDYELELSSGIARHINGTAFDQATPVKGARVYEASQKRTADVDDSGSFDLGVYPPGDYQLQLVAPGYSLMDGQQTATVTAVADGNVAFHAEANLYPDFTEPNNDGMTAYSLVNDNPIVSNFAPGLGDSADWFKCDTGLIGGYLVVIEVTYLPWHKDPSVSLYSDPLAAPLASANCSQVGYQKISYPVLGTGPATVYVKIDGQPSDYVVKVDIQSFAP